MSNCTFCTLLGIFIGKEGLPSSVSNVVTANELHLVRPHLMVNLLDTNLSCTDIPTLETPKHTRSGKKQEKIGIK